MHESGLVSNRSVDRTGVFLGMHAGSVVAHVLHISGRVARQGRVRVWGYVSMGVERLGNGCVSDILRTSRTYGRWYFSDWLGKLCVMCVLFFVVV